MKVGDPAAVLRRFLIAITTFDVEATLALLTEDATIEFPYAGKNFAGRLSGRDEIVAFCGWGRAEFGALRVHDLEVCALHPIGSRAVAEFRTTGHRSSTDRPYANRYVGLAWTAGRRIVQYREYFDPLADRRS
jgi:ketosteroid isomerase-like protein